MSTPTPDPPPAAPLTTEQIAEKPRWWNGLITIDDLHEMVAENDALAAVNAALRDRLARAEARCAALEGAIDGELGIYSPRYDEQRTVNARNERMCRSERVQRLRALLTTPTDGAARAGDAAGEKGDATDDDCPTPEVCASDERCRGGCW